MCQIVLRRLLFSVFLVLLPSRVNLLFWGSYLPVTTEGRDPRLFGQHECWTVFNRERDVFFM